MRQSSTHLPTWVDGVMLLVAALMSWQFFGMFLGPAILPTPVATVHQVVIEFRTPNFVKHLSATTRAFATAFFIAAGLGVPIGVMLGAKRLAAEVMDPILVTLYSIPKITLYPVILLIFGLDISARIAFGVIHGIIPIIIFTMVAVLNMPRVLLRSSRAYRLGRMATAWHVLMPAALPEIVAGLRIGFALTLLGTLLGEMFASQYGLGHLLMRAMERNETESIMALALLLFVFAAFASYVLLRLDRRLKH